MTYVIQIVVLGKWWDYRDFDSYRAAREYGKEVGKALGHYRIVERD